MKDLNISVVIPNYNGVHLFPETLPALYTSLENAGRPYEIIIVDDCSTDQSVEFLRNHFPDIILLINKINLGFSATINKGIFAARNQLVLLLNSDVKLTETYFSEQFKYFERPDTFGVMGKIIGWNDNIVQDGAKYPEMQGFKLKTSLNFVRMSLTKGFSIKYRYYALLLLRPKNGLRPLNWSEDILRAKL